MDNKNRMEWQKRQGGKKINKLIWHEKNNC